MLLFFVFFEINGKLAIEKMYISVMYENDKIRVGFIFSDINCW